MRVDETHWARANLLHLHHGMCIKALFFSSQEDDAFIPVDQRKWEFIPSAAKVFDECYPVSRQMTNLLRHYPRLPELAGAVAWETLITCFKGIFGQINKWSSQQWTECLREGTN